MKITQEADYALRVVLHLSKAGMDTVVDAKTISEKENVPLRFLLKLLRKLTSQGIVKSYRGINGGYSINKNPSKITFREVIEAIDGPICVNRCTVDPSFCTQNKTNKCEIHNALLDIREVLLKQLESVNFGDLI